MKRLFRFPWRTKRSIESDVDIELKFHIETRTERLVANGMDRDVARAQALREFGDMDDTRRYLNAVDRETETNRRRKDFVGDFVQDVIYAVRKLRSAPAFAITAIVTLAIGIGANTTVLNLINVTMLRPPPVHDVDGLAWVSPVVKSGRYEQWAYPDYVDFRAGAKAWTALSVMGNTDLTLGGQEPLRLSGQAVNGGFFDMLGVRPNPGRGFFAIDDSLGSGAMSIVISHSLWTRRFGADSAVVGTTAIFNTHPMTIIGVAPKNFNGMRIGEECDFWVPVAALPQLHRMYANTYTHRGSRSFLVVGRLANPSALAEAQAEASVLQARIDADVPKPEDRRTIEVSRIRGALHPASRARMGPILGMVMIVPLLVLGVACANVANLFVSRSVQRQKELAVRRALGASRGRLVRQLLTECAILGLLAGAVGIVMSLGLTVLISRTAQLPQDIVVLLKPDLAVFTITFLLAIVAGAVFGLVPALGATNSAITPALKNDGISMQVGRGRHRLRNAFVVSQVALSLTLLITAGLFVGSLTKALRVEPGYDPTNAISAGFDFGGQGYDTARVSLLQRQFMEQVAAAPGIEAVALAQLLPLSGSSNTGGIAREETSTDERDMRSMWSSVSMGYFAAMRIPVVQGRSFAETDYASAPKVVVINQQIAATLWPKQDPIGKRLRVGGNPTVLTVIGVARNGKYRRLSETEQEGYFWTPSTQDPIGSQGVLVVRGKTSTTDAVFAARQAMSAIDPTLPPLRVETLESLISRGVEGHRAGAALLGTFGALALGLAAFGIFGVIAQGVAARTREIGIRMSLGARTGDVVRAFVREGLGLTITGAAIGVALSLALSKVLTSLLFGLTPTDVLTFAGASLMLITLAAIASYLPARRAAKVDPLIALRSD